MSRLAATRVKGGVEGVICSPPCLHCNRRRHCYKTRCKRIGNCAGNRALATRALLIVSVHISISLSESGLLTAKLTPRRSRDLASTALLAINVKTIFCLAGFLCVFTIGKNSLFTKNLRRFPNSDSALSQRPPSLNLPE